MSIPDLPPDYFARTDERDDALFYSVPRKVMHIDEAAVRTLTNAYADLLSHGGVFLDLMSSWRSHLPLETLLPARVVGLGMNSAELEDNPQLDEFLVHDLNQRPRLPFPDAHFDAVLCALSVQYLTQPIAVFEEVWRVLRPNGRFILSYSNRTFPSKATAVWLDTDDYQHINLISYYFEKSGGWGQISARIRDSQTGAQSNEDPLYIIWAEKGGEGEEANEQ